MLKTIIGLTGAYCAGKNHIARLLEERGLPVLDVDKLGHRVIEKEKNAILERFGEGILNTDGSIDRKLLSSKVFGKPVDLAALEEIVHPGVIRMMDEWIESQSGRPCVINAALLHRTPIYQELKAVILAEAPVITRFLRAKKRDHLPWAAVFKRFLSQRKFSSQYFRKNTDIYRVENRGFFRVSSHLEKKLKNRINEILSLLGIG
jgi:dephospho-CoA kinase